MNASKVATRQERARKLRADGATYREIETRLGLSYSTVRRYLDPEFAERMRVASRDAKRRRRGRCRVCGAETSYNGDGKAVSDLCQKHAAQEAGLRRRGKGRHQLRLYAFLTQPRRYTAIRIHLGISSAQLSVMLNRELRGGRIRRLSRGVYVRGDA
jgi:uncharacterized protein YerC